MTEYKKRLSKALDALSSAEYILIGAGAGLSAAAGLVYYGSRFTENFADFITQYGLTDMYTASFYPFETQEERWAHWARHIHVNRYAMPATQLYLDLHALVKAKRHFVLTTNVESQFAKAGFSEEQLFATQGNYAYLQCEKGCHDSLYINEELIEKMLAQTQDCKIPSALVPRCPVCHGDMDVNLRHNEHFVQDQAWYAACARYEAFLKESMSKRIVFLELGVGFNTPGIIRFPFEQMTHQNPNATLIRINRDHPSGVPENKSKTIAFDEDAREIIVQLLTEREEDSNERDYTEHAISPNHSQV